jgi:hypothetical protein
MTNEELLGVITQHIDRNADDIESLTMIAELLVGIGYGLLGIIIRELNPTEVEKDALIAAMAEHGKRVCEASIAEHSSTLYRAQLSRTF